MMVILLVLLSIFLFLCFIYFHTQNTNKEIENDLKIRNLTLHFRTIDTKSGKIVLCYDRRNNITKNHINYTEIYLNIIFGKVV